MSLREGVDWGPGGDRAAGGQMNEERRLCGEQGSGAVAAGFGAGVGSGTDARRAQLTGHYRGLPSLDLPPPSPPDPYLHTLALAAALPAT